MKLFDRSYWEENLPSDLGVEHCPFCEENIDIDFVIFESTHWRVIHNKYPVLGLKNHIMAIPKQHYRFAYEIESKAMAEYPKVEKFIADFFEGGSYFTFMRESIQNRSLEHIHYHFLPGKINYKHLDYILRDQGFTNQLDSQ